MIPYFVQDHHWLNNNHFSPIRSEGLIFPSVWHAYIAAKTSDRSLKQEIAAVPLGGQLTPVAARVVQQIGFDAPGTMEELLKIKFGLTIQDLNVTNQMHMAKKLVGTGLQVLEFGNHTCEVEWGVCSCSRHKMNSDLEPIRASGQNILGQIIMKIRDIWRVYIEEVNVINKFCKNCGNPAEMSVLYTVADNPTFPMTMESCLKCQTQVFLDASHHSVDKMVVRYNSNEKQEDISTLKSVEIIIPNEEETTSILSTIKRYCPHCQQFIPLSNVIYCIKCGKYIGPMAKHQSPYTPSSYQTPYQSPTPAPSLERKYNSEEIIC